jgi:hypothetical protein
VSDFGVSRLKVNYKGKHEEEEDSDSDLEASSIVRVEQKYMR